MANPLGDGDPTRIGPYRLHARLGGGGMGQVFLGRSAGGHTVAVKTVRPDLVDDAHFRRRFAHEVRAARRVGGFYTAPVLDADPHADPPWLATAYIPGPSLHQAVKDRGPLPTGSVIALGAGLAEGLAAVHANELVHRDLKPANVILAETGPKLIDFGIARVLDATSHTQTSTVLGTAAFMSPEQARAERVGPASDVFSLGSVLAFAATGHGPFGKGPGHAIAYRIVHEEPDLSDLPQALTNVVAACLAKDPHARPSLDRLHDQLAALTPPTRTRANEPWLPEDLTEVITRYQTRLLTMTETTRHGEDTRRLRTPTATDHQHAPQHHTRPRRSPLATVSAVTALATLPAATSIPFTTVQLLDGGSMSKGEPVFHTGLCAILAIALTIGALLWLARNTAGRWLMAVGGTGLLLHALWLTGPATTLATPLHPASLAGLALTAITAAASTILALLPPTNDQRRRSRQPTPPGPTEKRHRY